MKEWYECDTHSMINSNVKFCMLCGNGNNMKVITKETSK